MNQVAAVTPGRIPAGFQEPVLDAQASFRALMRALSYPGRIVDAPTAAEAPEGWPPALAAAALTLLDADTPVWLDPAAGRSDDAAAYLRFHTGAPIVGRPEDCRFAVALRPEAAPYDLLPVGVDQYPDRSMTLLVGLPALTGGAVMQLAGPGIETIQTIAPAGDLNAFWRAWARNHALYPLGWDAFLFAGVEAIGLPRGVAAEAIGG